MLINQSNLSSLFIGFDTKFNEAFKDSPSVADKIADTIPCSTSTLALPFLQLFPQMRQWQGDRVVNNYVLQDVQVTPLLWELTASIPRTSIEDDQYGVYVNMGASRLAREVKSLVDKQLAATVEANATGFDGVAFFATSHPIDPSGALAGTQSNWYDSTHTGAAAMPLDATHVGTLRAAMMAMQGPDGLPLGLTPNVIMVPPALEMAARQVANAAFYPTSIGGSAGPISNVFQGAYEVVVNPYLTDSLAWYLLATNEGVKPFAWVERTAPELSSITDPQNPLVFMKDQYLVGARRRGAATGTLYFLAMKARNA